MWLLFLVGVLPITCFISPPSYHRATIAGEQSNWGKSLSTSEVPAFHSDCETVWKILEDSRLAHDNFIARMKSRESKIEENRERMGQAETTAPGPHQRFLGAKFNSEGYLGSRLTEYRNKQIFEFERKFFKNLQMGYSSLMAGSVDKAKSYVSKAENMQISSQDLQVDHFAAGNARIILSEDESYQQLYKDFEEWRKKSLHNVKKEELLTRLDKLAQDRSRIEEGWNQARAVPKSKLMKMKKWLLHLFFQPIQSMTKDKAISAATRAFQNEVAAHEYLKNDRPWLAFLATRASSHFQKKAERLREQIYDDQKAQINLYEMKLYKEIGEKFKKIQKAGQDMDARFDQDAL